MSENNDEKIKKAMRSAPIPEAVSPENMKKMLDEKAPAKKRRNIKKTALQITAGVAACAVICGIGVYYLDNRNSYNKCKIPDYSEANSTGSAESEQESFSGTSYMNASSGYHEIHEMIKDAAADYRKNAEEIVYDVVDEEKMLEETADDADGATNNLATGKEEYSDTYNQESGVLEADIVKTDGEYIYYLYNNYDSENEEYQCLMNIAKVENGDFTDSNTIDLLEDMDIENEEYMHCDAFIEDMYLYNDMLLVIGIADIWNEYGAYSVEDASYGWLDATYTFVNVYTLGIEPQLVDSYSQDGRYNDVRINSDGFLYMITNDYSESFYRDIPDEDDIEAYIPKCTIDGEAQVIPYSDILIPDGALDDTGRLAYTIIGALDLNTAGEINESDIKAVAGYSGNIYCSENNLYTASGRSDTTKITRFSLESGTITPAASGSVKGYVKDQFSMSEYSGYFRVAATHNDWSNWDERRDSNYVYVLDMDLNVVGSVTDFGNNEVIKSVSFKGDMAYVVTYEQTDPLFAVDLSDPQQPKVLDEYKITGYSSYMQQWDDGLLLGFGVDADEQGIEHGVKLVMFDNSDPENLNEVGFHAINNEDENVWISSNALWERKSLLIAPEKNLIGVPVNISRYTGEANYENVSAYMFFAYDNGEFISRGEISRTNGKYMNRALYIGDYLYVMSANRFISADIESVSQIKSVDFE